jgi:FtsP/CotA-like multicopper oxidase with cupredoxin domain
MNRLMRRRHLVMRARTNKKTAAGGFAILVALLAALLGGSASAATVNINLCATTGTATMPDSTSVPIWAFVRDPADCSLTTGTATIAPPLSIPVTRGDVVNVTMSSNLPAGAAAPDLEIPGITVVPTGPNSWTFTAGNVGSYLFESGADSGRQEAMGLYGSLIVSRAATDPVPAGGTDLDPTHYAYDSAISQFTDQQALVLSAIDPNFNANPLTFQYTTGDYKTGFRAVYWLINGHAYTDSDPAISHTAGGRLLLRFLNAGYDNTSMSLVGIHDRVVARDAHLLGTTLLADNETIPAGGREDAVIDFSPLLSPGVPPNSKGYPLFNRELHVTNGAPSQVTPVDGGGGMMTFIAP